MIDECQCENKYTIEHHGDGYALYYGRCDHRHGYNLAYLTETAWNFEPRHLENMLNLGTEVYHSVSKMYNKGEPLGGHVAE